MADPRVRQGDLGFRVARGPGPRIGEIIARLADRTTAVEAAVALADIAPLPAEHLETVMAAAEGAEDLQVLGLTASALWRFGEFSVRAVPLLERLLEKLAPERRFAALWPLLHIDPEHEVAGRAFLTALHRVPALQHVGEQSGPARRFAGKAELDPMRYHLARTPPAREKT